MLIIKIMGGFASQFNKYVLGRQIAEYMGTELFLDLRDYSSGYFRAYSLSFLELPAHRVILNDNQMSEFGRIIYIRTSDDMVNMLRSSNSNRIYYIDREEGDYRSALDQWRMLEIHPQSKLLQNLKFRYSTPFYDQFRKELSYAEVSVAVHIRRGDFLTLGWQDDIEFYRAAMDWFLEHNPRTNFYFFSNDMKWVRSVFPEYSGFHFVESSNGLFGDIQELFCMAYCDYRILSRFSSYGRLANILSAAWREGHEGYALMNGTKLRWNAEGQHTQSEIDEKFSFQIEQEIPVRGDEGGILYLGSKQIVEHSFHFESWLRDIQQSKQMVSEKKMNVSCEDSDSCERLWLQYEFYKKRGDRGLQRNCLSAMSYDAGISSEWSEIYGLEQGNGRPLVILTDEKWNRWKINGAYLLSVILARCGYIIYYINWNAGNTLILNIDDAIKRTTLFSDACTMDGDFLGFRYLMLCEGNLGDVLDGVFQEIEEELTIVISGSIPSISLSLLKGANRCIRILKQDRPHGVVDCIRKSEDNMRYWKLKKQTTVCNISIRGAENLSIDETQIQPFLTIENCIEAPWVGAAAEIIRDMRVES